MVSFQLTKRQLNFFQFCCCFIPNERTYNVRALVDSATTNSRNYIKRNKTGVCVYVRNCNVAVFISRDHLASNSEDCVRACACIFAFVQYEFYSVADSNTLHQRSYYFSLDRSSHCMRTTYTVAKMSQSGTFTTFFFTHFRLLGK